MLSLVIRLWENIKYEEKEPIRKENKRFSDEGKSAYSEGSPASSAKRGPKEYASGVNDKGQHICYT